MCVCVCVRVCVCVPPLTYRRTSFQPRVMALPSPDPNGRTTLPATNHHLNFLGGFRVLNTIKTCMVCDICSKCVSGSLDVFKTRFGVVLKWFGVFWE